MQNHTIYKQNNNNKKKKKKKKKKKAQNNRKKKRWKALKLLAVPSIHKHIIKLAYSLLMLTVTLGITDGHFHASKYIHFTVEQSLAFDENSA